MWPVVGAAGVADRRSGGAPPLCGPEGSGTRTLLHLLSGHLLADAGRVLVDGRERGPRRGSMRPDPRRFASGPEESVALLADPGRASVLLLERPTVGLDDADAHRLVARARRCADDGVAVVLTTDGPEHVSGDATTLALLVAGRLLSWGAPPVALVPALHILGAGGLLRDAGQAGSIITPST
jgi:ABC-type multidrug transport system ATPase subunit